MSSNHMSKEALDSYVRGTPAGRQTHKLSEELNSAPGGIELPDVLPSIDPFHIKIFGVRVLPIDEKTGERIPTTIWHGQHGTFHIPSAEPAMKAVPAEDKPRGTYTMVPCAKQEAYGRPLCIPNVCMYTHHNTQTGATEVLPKDIIRGEDVAKSIINAPGYETDLTPWGYFATYNDVPTAEEIAAAVARLKAKYQALYNEGDSLAVQGKVKNITNTMREAAAWLGVRASWNQVVEMYETCEGCGENVKDQVVIHSCGWVRNWQKAVENGMRTLKQVPNTKRWWSEPTLDAEK